MQNNRLIKAAGTALAMALLLGACSSRTLRPDLGMNIQHNTIVQAVDPGAEGRVRPLATVDGEKLEKGLIRYRVDRPDASRDTLVKISN